MVNKKTIAAVFLLGAVLLAVIMTAGCVNTEQADTADTIFYGNVITMDDNNPSAEAVAVKDGIIVFVGSAADAEAFRGETTEIIDYGDYSIYPGFLEAHCHVSGAGTRSYGMAKLSPAVPLSKTLEEIKDYIQKNPGRQTYIGSGWSFGGEEPNAAMLDAVCSDVPVILVTGDGHSLWVNSKALASFNYTPEYIKEMGPAQIRVDANGNPTGYISETPAAAFLKKLPYTVEELKEFFLKWQDEAFAMGYTGVADAGVEITGDKQYQVYDELEKEGKLKMQIAGLSLVKDNTDTPEEDMAKINELAKKYNSKHFNVIGAKVFIDGVIEAHSAWMIDAYKDQPGYYGVKRFTDTDKMAALITAADKYGMLVHAHAVGDAAAKMFADAVEKSVKETGNYDQRNAAAHLQYITPEDIKRFGKYGIVAVSGYQWCPTNNVSYPVEEKYVGADYAKKGYPAKSFVNAGSVVVGHTDYPVSPIVNVPLAFYNAVERNSPFEGTGVRGPEEALTREEALASLTTNVAYSMHAEDRMGSLEPGKLANMAVLSVDLLHDDMDDIALATVTKNVATIVDGEIVYSAEPEKLTEKEIEEFIELLASLPEVWAQNEAAEVFFTE